MPAARLPQSLLNHPLTLAARSLLAVALALLLSPLLAPALSHSLPNIAPVRLYERLAVRLLSLVATLCGVRVHLRPRHEAAPHAHLPGPLVRSWESPLPRAPAAARAVTYDQPGRWMRDAELGALGAELETVARRSIGAVPAHRVFDRARLREALANRVVCVARDPRGPLAFTAMAYLPVPRGDVVVHLGLTMIARRARGHRLQSSLFSKTLLLAAVNLARPSFHVTNCGASPAGFGSVCDYFFACYPSYARAPRRDHHLRIARHVLRMYRYEFGCSDKARFDERSFVVFGSNEAEGGGTHQFIRKDNAPVSAYRLEACNDFVAGLIDFSKGDEVFQVATFNFLGSFVKYITSPKHRRPRSK